MTDPIDTPVTYEAQTMTDTTTETDPTATPAPAAPRPPAGLISARGRWAAPPLPPQSLSTVRLGEDATLIVPFTDSAALTSRHFIRSATGNGGYVRCEGGGCLLCALGKKAEDVTLLPVYVPADGAVRVLAIGDNVRPGALGPKLVPILDRVMAGEKLVVEIRRLPDFSFEVAAFPLTPGGADGAPVIAQFLANLTSGAVRLADVYPARPRAELLSIPGLAAEALMRGIES
ncbi:hypothetical protein [Urbifossiella limnaea]|uniref:hypothetical protein n=1 Tax=Urbifossiella limnaea TaxID=2528023 RepID=UPI0011A94B3A|nr:hypothetical protein [Urbifossiella limnaea]